MAVELSGAILAAGRGERLRSNSAIPKPLLELNGETLLMRQIRLIRAAGASPVQVIVNSETHRGACERGLSFPAEVRLIIRDTPNSMESLLALGERIAPGQFLLLTVDAVMTEREIGAFVANATRATTRADSRLDGAIGVVRWRGDANPLFVQLLADGTIGELGARPSSIVTAGVYLLPSAIFKHAAQARALGLDAMRLFLAMLLDKQMRFAAVQVAAAIDVDNGADLRAARELLAREAD